MHAGVQVKELKGALWKRPGQAFSIWRGNDKKKGISAIVTSYGASLLSLSFKGTGHSFKEMTLNH
jgi:hypothetical protein